MTTVVGDCEFCGTKGALVLDAAELQVHFAPLVAAYEADATGEPLINWLKRDWALFDHPDMAEETSRALLNAVLHGDEWATWACNPSPRFQSDGLIQWEHLRDELMFQNRYFPEAQFDADRFRGLIGLLEAVDLPTVWYRARLQQGDVAFAIENMGAPPKKVVSHGRANPPGIQYLYLGSSEQSVVSEIRPHTGEIACIAEFVLANDLAMIDLRNPRKSVSPFTFGDEDLIGRMRTELPLLERLGDELARPVLPQGAAIDYVPSQYLCEFIKKADYNGVIYRSSVSDGMNLALFDPSKASPGAGGVKQRRVTRVSISVE